MAAQRSYQQEPPKFQKPSSFRYILGVRKNSGSNQGGYGSAQAGRPSKTGRASQTRESNSRLLNVQYQEADSGFRPIGSGVRNNVSRSSTMQQTGPRQVDPIDDPFGDLSRKAVPATRKYTRKSTSFVVPVQNQSKSSGFQPPVQRTAARPSATQQESILRRPGNSPSQSRPVSERTESLDNTSLEPRLRRALEGQPRVEQEAPMNTTPMNTTPMRQDNSGFQAADPMVETPMNTPMGNTLRQDDPMDVRQKYELDCADLKGVLFQKSVRDIALNLKPRVEQGKDIPQYCDFDVFPAAERCWCPQSFMWTASAACSKPLYFQHIQLERYGHSRGPIIQPILSAAHFFGNVAIYPYKAGIHPYNECMYALGYYRPGDCAPWLREPFPWSIKGAASQATSAIGYTGVFR